MVFESNKKVKLCIISPFPTHKIEEGVAFYTKSLVENLSSKEEVENITILSNTLGKNFYKKNKKIEIYGCWKKGILYPFQIFKTILKRDFNIFHIQHEFFLFGESLSLISFPLLLILIKVLKKPIIITFHGVIPISTFNEVVVKFRLPSLSLWKFFPLFYLRFIALFVNRIIVHEKYFKEVLKREYFLRKPIDVIPHGIKVNVKKVGEAKKILGLKGKKVLLFFGYLAPYKGLEILLESFKYLDENFVLLICGGLHPRLKQNKGYRKYVKIIKKIAKNISKNIIFKGFIKDEELPLYFSATDLLIFPYQVLISSSGPLCLALSYEKPFLVSENLGKIIKKKDFTFKMKADHLAIKICEFFKKRSGKSKLLKYIKKLKIKNSWENVALKHLKLYKGLLK